MNHVIWHEKANHLVLNFFSLQDRPHSVVDHVGSGVEGTRQRMSVEEQMERIRRHQQGTLRERERRREDGSLSRSLSFTKDRTFYYTLQVTPTFSSIISFCLFIYIYYNYGFQVIEQSTGNTIITRHTT